MYETSAVLPTFVFYHLCSTFMNINPEVIIAFN